MYLNVLVLFAGFLISKFFFTCIMCVFTFSPCSIAFNFGVGLILTFRLQVVNLIVV